MQQNKLEKTIKKWGMVYLRFKSWVTIFPRFKRWVTIFPRFKSWGNLILTTTKTAEDGCYAPP